jgi:hypothetical protein
MRFGLLWPFGLVDIETELQRERRVEVLYVDTTGSTAHGIKEKVRVRGLHLWGNKQWRDQFVYPPNFHEIMKHNAPHE